MDDFLRNEDGPDASEPETAGESKAEEFIFDDYRQEEIDPRHRDFYQKLRRRIRNWAQSEEGRSYRWAEYLLVAPDLFHLLCRLAVDRDVLLNDKLKLAAAIAYFVSPFDIIPEVVLGPIGYADDVVIAAYVLNSIVNNTDAEVLRRNWAGEDDILELMQSLLHKADEMIGTGTWQNIKAMFRKGSR